MKRRRVEKYRPRGYRSVRERSMRECQEQELELLREWQDQHSNIVRDEKNCFADEYPILAQILIYGSTMVVCYVIFLVLSALP